MKTLFLAGDAVRLPSGSLALVRARTQGAIANTPPCPRRHRAATPGLTDEQDQFGQFLRGFPARPGDRHADAAHRHVGRRRPLHRALSARGSRCSPRTPSPMRSAIPRAPVDDLLVFHIVFGKTVPDISLNAVANLGYADCRFLAPVYPGDTLSSTSEVIGLKENSNGQTGVVYVRSRGFNQRGDCVLEYVRWVMVRKRDPNSPVAGGGHAAAAASAVAPASSATPCRRSTRANMISRWPARPIAGAITARRAHRPCRRHDGRGGRAPARHAPLPEHREGPLQPILPRARAVSAAA